MPKLQSLQAWMMQVITHPDGVQHGADSSNSRSIVNVGSNQLDRIVLETQAWPASDRLGIYWHAYFARLLECLREEYPILLKTIGQEAFDELAYDYLRKFPPTSYTLSQLGTQFSKYLEMNRPVREAQDDKPDWIDFLVDLARFEWLINEVFDGPGVEEAEAFLGIDLTSLSPEQADSLSFECVPCLHLCAFRFPVHTYREKMKADQPVDAPIASPTYVAVTRQNYIVKHFTLAQTEYALLSCLQQGLQLGEAIESVCSTSENDANEVSANIAEWFSTWSRRGFFQRLH